MRRGPSSTRVEPRQHPYTAQQRRSSLHRAAAAAASDPLRAPDKVLVGAATVVHRA